MRLGLFSPGSPPRPDRLEKGKAWLAARGFVLHQPAGLVAGDGLHAGPPEERARALRDLLLDDGVEAILCTRGGSGTAGILPHIDLELVRRHRKLIIGMSDVTALHLALWGGGGIPGVSGQMVVQLSDELPSDAGEWWLRLVRGPFPGGPVPCPAQARPRPLAGAASGSAEGTLLPANLSLLVSLIGTPYLPSLRGAILILEDIHETPQSLDRMIHQIELSGVARSLAGVVLGQFTECRPRGEGVTEADGRELLERWARSLGVPAITDFPYGHESPALALPFGTRGRLRADPPALELLESPDAGLASRPA